jgi:glucose/mannose-6-phosphate isomerase
MMMSLVDRFPAQLQEALEIGAAATIRPHTKAINKVYLAGLGGSGIGGDYVAEFVADECKVPYIVGKGYGIPAFIDENTLFIASSYSGNTEETLAAFDLAKNTGAKIVIVSSGGKLTQYAQDLDLDYITVPGDWPSPRACLGFSFVQQLFILNKLGMIGTSQIDQIKASINLLKFDQDDIKTEAEKVAKQLFGKLPIIYTTDRMEAVAVRFRQQINENSKALCWHHVIPEMNHNELVGWRDKNESLAVVYFRNKDDHKRNATRIDINKEIISKYASPIIEIWSKGTSLVEQAMYLTHVGDYISCYLADMRGMDSIEVDVIDYLKGELAKL